MKFIDSALNLINNLTLDKFIEYYKEFTSLIGDSIIPDKKITESYFNFIKQLKPNYEKDIIAVVVAPRECFKSTTFSYFLPLLFIINSFKNNDDLSLVYLASNQFENAYQSIYFRIVSALNNISKLYVLKSDKYRTYLKNENKEMAINIGHINMSLRSRSFKGKRPQLIIADDIDIPYASEEIKARKRSITMFFEDWIPAREKGNSIIIVTGNIESKTSIISTLLSLDFTHKLILPYKINNEYIRETWNKEWENKTRKLMGDDGFERQYNHQLPADKIEFYKTKGIGQKIILIDPGISENNFVLVYLIGNTIANVFYTSYDRYFEIFEIIQSINPNIIIYESNSFQRFLGEKLKEKFPHTLIEEIRTDITQSSKLERMLKAYSYLNEGKITLLNEEVEEIIKEEIEKMNSNSHVLDILGAYIENYIESGGIYISV